MVSVTRPENDAPAQTREGAADAVRLVSVEKIYGEGTSAVTALGGVSVGFRRGTFTAVMGPSGSGKSTLLHCAAGLDRPTSGQVLMGDVDLARLDERRMTLMRREKIGFVFQSLNLVPTLTAEQNILLPLRLAGRRPDRELMTTLVNKMGIEQRIRHRPAKMSIGQQQRVAIARALVTRPEVIFADEPTGALDTKTSRDILALLRDAVDSLGQTIVMVTHDPTAAGWADRAIFLVDGQVIDDMPDPTTERVAERMTRLEA